MNPFQCPHNPRALIQTIVGTKVTELEACKDCMASVIQARMPDTLKKGLPFIVRISTEGTTLILQGSWEGMPRYLTSKEVSGVLKYLGHEEK